MPEIVSDMICEMKAFRQIAKDFRELSDRETRICSVMLDEVEQHRENYERVTR